MVLVTTVFRDFEFIEETLASVMGQRGPGRPVFHIIKDASPTDAGFQLVKRCVAKHSNKTYKNFSYQLLYWHKPDDGLYPGLKEIFKHVLEATRNPNTLVTYLNADDLLEPEALKRVCRLQEATGAEWLVSAPQMIDHRSRTLLRSPRGVPYSQQRIREGHHLIEGQPFLQQEGTFWSLGLFQSCRGFNPKLQLAGDFDLWLQLASQCAPLCLPVASGSFRRRPGQKSENIEAYRQEALAVLNAAQTELAAAPPASSQAWMALDIDGQPAVAAVDPEGGQPTTLKDPLVVDQRFSTDGILTRPVRLQQRWRRRAPQSETAKQAIADLGLNPSNWLHGDGQHPLRLRLRGPRAGFVALELELLLARSQPTVELLLKAGDHQRIYRIESDAIQTTPLKIATEVHRLRLQLLEFLSPELDIEVAIQGSGVPWFCLNHRGEAARIATANEAGWPYLADPSPLEEEQQPVPITALLDATGCSQLELQQSLVALQRQNYPALQVAVWGASHHDAVLEQFSDDLQLQRLTAAPTAEAIGQQGQPNDLLVNLCAGDLLEAAALRRVARADSHKPVDLIGGDQGAEFESGWFWRRQTLARWPDTSQELAWETLDALRLGTTLVHAQSSATLPPRQAITAALPRLLFINDVGRCGGAGLAHHRLLSAVQQHGCPVLSLSAAEHWDPDGHPVRDWRRLERQIQRFAPSAIVCGNLHGLRCDHLTLLRQLAAAAPCFWVAHDFWPSNGRQPYPSLDAGEALPAPNAESERWQQQLLAIDHLHLIANSHFCHHVLAGTALAPRLVDQVLPLGVERRFNRLNPDWDAKRHNRSPRLQLLVGSVGMDDPRKGAALLVAALGQLPANQRAQLDVRSYGHTPIDALHGLCAYGHLGYLDESGIRVACAEADLYINCSLIETFGQVSVEALLAGAWLVSVRNGGVSDFARDGENATLVEAQADALTAGLERAIERLQAIQRRGPDAIERHRNRQALSVDRYSLENSGLQLLRILLSHGVEGPPDLGFAQTIRPTPLRPAPRGRLR